MFGLFYQLAPAAAATPASSSPFGGNIATFLPIILMVVFMYFLIIMPENKRRKKLQKQINELKQGDRIVTVGNIIGTVEFIGEKTVYIKSLDVKLEVAKTGVATVLEDGKI